MIAGRENRFWSALVGQYHKIVDSLRVDTSQIVVLAGDPDSLTEDYTSSLEDTLIIDYRYTLEECDSALAWIAANMDSLDVLHVINNGHGAGYYDSACVTYGDDGSLGVMPHEECVPDHYITAATGDPDEDRLESQFKLVWYSSSGYRRETVGMNQWAGSWSTDGRISRWKTVATFDSMYFYNDPKTSDTDAFIEEIVQYHAADDDHNYTVPDSLWDFDGDGNPPIDTVANGYVFDDDDWGDYRLRYDKDYGDSTFIFTRFWFDAGFDGVPECCFRCTQAEAESLLVHGVDSNNDGLLVGLDVNKDGDQSDSAGVTECFYQLGTDDYWSDFLDQLSYDRVTFVLLNCFSGGFINDLSRSNVLVGTAAPEGTVAWGERFTAMMAINLTHGHSVDADSNQYVSMKEAFNYYGEDDDSDGRERFDDNGDGVGHSYPLDSGGDGPMADSIWYGILPPMTSEPIPVSPLSLDTLNACLSTFVWSDTLQADSFDLKIQSNGYTDSFTGLTDTTFTLEGPPLDDWVNWRVYAWYDWLRSDASDNQIGIVVDTVDTCCCAPCCVNSRGNVNGDTLDQVNISDLVYLASYLYSDGDAPPCMQEANVDASPCGGMPDSLDLQVLQAYIEGRIWSLPDCP
jgi:hypothetical protein